MKKIIKLLLFIKDIDMLELSENVSVSYTSIRNFLIYHKKMTVKHQLEIFNFLEFDYTRALILSEENLSRVGLLKEILKEIN